MQTLILEAAYRGEEFIWGNRPRCKADSTEIFQRDWGHRCGGEPSVLRGKGRKNREMLKVPI